MALITSAILQSSLLACVDKGVDDGARLAVPSLILDEVLTWEIEDPARFQGGAILDPRTVIAWTGEGDLWLFRGGLPPAEIAGAPRAVVISPTGDASALVISRSDGSLFRVHASGSVESLGASCPVLSAARSVVSAFGGLLAVVQEGGGEGENGAASALAFVRTGLSSCSLVATHRLACQRGEPSLAPLGGQDAWITAACPDPAATLFRVSLNEQTLEISQIPESIPVSPPFSAPAPGPLWYGLPVVSLDAGFLRVISDLRSHRRRFELWDANGFHLRTSTIDDPIGFVAASVRHQLLFGMRTDPEFLIVLTRWSWQSGPST